MDNGVNFSQNTIFCIFTSYRIDIRVRSSINSDMNSSQITFDGLFKHPKTEHVITLSPIVSNLCISLYNPY